MNDKITTIYSKSTVYFPLYTVLLFLVFSELLFFFGPIDWNVNNSLVMGIYFVILNIALFSGFYSGVNSYKIRDPKKKIRNVLQVTRWLIWLSLLFFFFRIIALWGISSLSPYSIYLHLYNSIVSPDLVYENKLALISGPIIYLTLLFSPFTFMTLPIALYNYPRLSKLYKYLTIILCIQEILVWVGQGVRKGILDVILIVLFISVAKNENIVNNLKVHKKIVLITFLVLCLFLYYFLYSNLKRYGLENPEDLIDRTTIFNIKDSYKNVSSIILMIVASIEGYLCQGYYALSCALSSDFVFSYGMGSSWFGVNLCTRLGIDILPYTYIYQLYTEYGIDPMINWHSLYTWLASDFTFYGVPLVIFIMGRFYALSWLDTLCNRSIFAPACFCLFLIMIFYSFANNQIFSLQFIAFWGVFILWLNDRKIVRYLL